MTHGFDLNSPLICEGIVGDGCGGGRIFFVEDEKLQVFDPVTKETMELLSGIQNVKKITKSACIIRIELLDGFLDFDLSALKKV